MSEDRNEDISARRKRVKRLKRLIVLTLLILLLFPPVCCVVLLVQMQKMNARMDELAGQMAVLKQRLHQEAGSTGEAAGVSVSMVQGAAPDADALPSQQSMDSVAGEADWQEQAEESREEAEKDLQPEETQIEPRHKVYLTFDDGPSIYTDQILDTLEEYDVKATFFVVGKEDERSREAICRIVEDGHTLGMHSYSHKYSELYASEESFAADLDKLQDYLYELTGVESHFYRFPGGSSNTVSSVGVQELADYLDSRGIVFYDWNISSGDGGSTLLSADTLVRNSTDGLEEWDTAMILMHDSGDKPTTVEALPAIIEKILAMEDTAILPITEDTVPVQHIYRGE